MGNPRTFATHYFDSGADELFYQDLVASLYGRSSIVQLIEETVREVFVPVTVGGGIRSVEDAISILRAGADKISINSAALSNPRLISQLADVFGKQAVVVNIEAKKIRDGKYEALLNQGRDHSGFYLEEWIESINDLGAGEILLTSVDREGTLKGFDIELLRIVRGITGLPIICHGGIGKQEDVLEVFENGGNAVALASVLHFHSLSIKELKTFLSKNGVDVRP